MPSSSFEKQSEENNKEIALKKLSNEIILGKSTENTAMELDTEGGASFEQLQELIKKECDKRDKKYQSLEQKYNTLQESLEHSQQKKMPRRGPRGASNKKKSQPSNQRRVTTQRGRSTSRRRLRPPTGRNGKAEGTNNDATSDNLEKQKRNRRSRSQQKKKPTSSDRNMSRQPSKTN